MKVLTFSTLFPSSVRPGHGIFVETRLRELLKSGQVESRVIAPVPWFPSTNPRWGDYARFAATPAREQRNGIDVLHPRYLLAPKIGMTSAPLTLALGARAAVRRLIDEGFDFDLIDAHYYYPDGVAAALLAQWFDKPLTITARGSDINLITRHALPLRFMRWASRVACASIGVSQALVERMRELGVASRQQLTLRNGVDLTRFQASADRTVLRARLGVDGSPLLLSVGNLVPLKGHNLVIESLGMLRQQGLDARLCIIGAGPLRSELETVVGRLGLARKVCFLGALPQDELAAWYGAADVLMLASEREGWPNVLLESMACGTPVVATAVGGIPEIVETHLAGRVVKERTAQALADAVLSLWHALPPREAVRDHACRFGWHETTQGQVDLFQNIVGTSRHA
ncbi:glycosyltransferase family 4 protein [Roseateles saccharophilus]|uniref:glycosyltransferase family 4 protein n=1 Tax=Roseateles saccharophilus TaxID=304 RepID=UPI00104449EF|nr:glycosyltransferase family 4 protein [Roseateles saccharophilus]MDG0835186.1 glycosyltransferase family 4 protein [Roseateles saccharophilus]